MLISALFALLSLIFVNIAWTNKGLWWVCCWPALSFGWVSLAYLLSRPKMFGKRRTGSLQLGHQLLLFPFTLCNQGLWHLLRVIRREEPFHQLKPDLFVGRRLLPSEFPDEFEYVLDLTADFSEPRKIRESVRYRNLSILDAGIPMIDELKDVLTELSSEPGIKYIHCAEGHGRTCLVTACYLMTHENLSLLEAIEQIQQARPKAGANRKQLSFLEQWESNKTPD